MFSKEEYKQISEIVFKGDYPGYRPHVIESPDGDGVFDDKKLYAHVATKYLGKYENEINRVILNGYLEYCHSIALTVAKELGLPQEFYPCKARSAMRVLYYPPGAVTNPHNDFDLFTLMMYRDDPSKFKFLSPEPESKIQAINGQAHYGELLKEIGVCEPTRHEVVASDSPQRSIVYFAIPEWHAMLPSGISVGEWLEERLSRSRKEV